MASTTSIKDTGIPRLLFLGLLLPSVLVSGQITAPTTTTFQASSNATSLITTNPATAPSSTGMSTSTASPPTVLTANGGTVTTVTTTEPLTSTSGGSASSTTQPITSTSEGTASSSTHSASFTSGGSASTITMSPTNPSEGTTSSSTHLTSSTSGGSASSITQSTTNTSEGGLDTMNSTSAWPTSVMTQIYCPSFSCSSSECYSMYMSQNATLCAAANYCQLLRSTNMWYNVSCSSSCAERCINSSQTNCSVNCCNSTGCLNATFSSMMVTTTMATTTTTAKPSQPATTTTTTTANNGNKCQTGTCNGDTCYTSFKDKTETCSSSQPHCQLRKDIKDSITTWTAGCSNCTDLAACTASTASPCVLECCKAATISCLRLNGTSNVLSFATRGPHLHKELIVSSLCLLALTLLL